jgi:hypothetical protein
MGHRTLVENVAKYVVVRFPELQRQIVSTRVDSFRLCGPWVVTRALAIALRKRVHVEGEGAPHPRTPRAGSAGEPAREVYSQQSFPGRSATLRARGRSLADTYTMTHVTTDAPDLLTRSQFQRESHERRVHSRTLRGAARLGELLLAPQTGLFTGRSGR